MGAPASLAISPRAPRQVELSRLGRRLAHADAASAVRCGTIVTHAKDSYVRGLAENEVAMRLKSCLVALAIGALAGCTSFAQVQQSEPKLSGTFDGQYEAMAVCITRGWLGHIGSDVNLLVDHANSEAVVIIGHGLPSTQATNETLVRQVSETQVRVEYRRAPNLLGIEPPWLWDTVEGCAQA